MSAGDEDGQKELSQLLSDIIDCIPNIATDSTKAANLRTALTECAEANDLEKPSSVPRWGSRLFNAMACDTPFDWIHIDDSDANGANFLAFVEEMEEVFPEHCDDEVRFEFEDSGEDVEISIGSGKLKGKMTREGNMFAVARQ